MDGKRESRESILLANFDDDDNKFYFVQKLAFISFYTQFTEKQNALIFYTRIFFIWK